MSSLTHPEAPESSLRRERAAIAAQACQTCRNRKSKCDEQRPKCGLCRRLNVECEYREPLPTKKDKTMVHILDTLTRLENKFDNLSMTHPPGTNTPDLLSPGSVASPHMSVPVTDNPPKAENVQPAKQSYQHLTVPHKIMLWPSIYIHLVNSGIAAASDLQYVLQEGTPWFIKRELAKHPQPLSADAGLPSFNIGPSEQGRSSPHVAFPTLTIQQIQEYSDAYFNTYNVLYPLLNRNDFMNHTAAKLLREGYSESDTGCVLALLVFALGQVAVEGVFERPISVVNGQPSGFRGGSLERPPGLGLFNEARRRMGFVMSQNSLENVQIMLLQATYYESTARHIDYWRSTVSASMACQVLIRCNPTDWESRAGDFVKRAYWTCVLSEDLYHLDLDLPQSGIHTLEDEVPLPYFYDLKHDQEFALKSPSASTPADHTPAASEEQSHFQYHFLAIIALRRLITRIHHVIHECERSMQAEPLWQGSGLQEGGAFAKKPLTGSMNDPENMDNYSGPPVAVVREMVRQLDSWRALLPRALQWNDADMFGFPASDPNSRRPNEPLFAPDQGPIPIGHKYNLDVVTAQLRTRFYYARFMIYRLFVYKALHFPELLQEEDYKLCALAIKSACLWPLAMAPPKNKKRLVPHMFAWTQNFIGILLVLRMCSVNAVLKRIVDEGGVVGRQEIDGTISLLLEWVRDVRQMDGIAEWAWGVLKPLFFGQ